MTQTSEHADSPAPCCPDLAGLIDPGLFKALSDPSRVALIAHLGRRGRPTTVSEASACCPLDLSVVSRHLATLRRAGVVEAERRGREVRYTLAAEDLAAGLRSLADALDACCPPDRNSSRRALSAGSPIPPTEV